MAFSHPSVFLLLLLIPALPLLRALHVLKQPAVYAVLAEWGGEKRVVRKTRHCVSIISKVLGVMSYVCAVTAAAGPVATQQDKVYQGLDAEVMFIVDTSPSMAARDMDGISRLDAAKKAIKNMAENTGGAALGLTAMASEAAVVVPATGDKDTFLSRLDSLSPGYMGYGTALGTALATAACHIAQSRAHYKYCVLVTDGESNAGFVDSQTAATLLTKEGVALYVLGVGTNGNVPLEYTDPESGQLHQGTFESHFDPTVLKEVASAGGGKYFGIHDQDALAAVLSDVSRGVTLTQSYYLKAVTTDKSTKPLLLAVIFAAATWIFKRLFLQEVL